MKSLSKVITLKSNCFPSLMLWRLFISIRDFFKNSIPLRMNLLTFSRKRKLCTLVIEHYTKFFDSLVLCQMIRKRPLNNYFVTDSSLFVKKDEADSFTLKELLSNIVPGHKDSLRIRYTCLYQPEQDFTFTYVLKDLYSMPTNQQLSISQNK